MIFGQFPTLHFGLALSGSQPFNYTVFKCAVRNNNLANRVAYVYMFLLDLYSALSILYAVVASRDQN